MVRRVFPAPVDDTSATTTSSIDSPWSALSPGPLTDEHHHHIKRPYLYKDTAASTASTTSNRHWTDDAAQFVTQSCWFPSYGYGESGGGTASSPFGAPPWMDWLWLCEGEGMGRRKRRSRRTRYFLQQQQQQQQPQQPSGSLKQETNRQAEEKTVDDIPDTTSNLQLLEEDYARLHEEFFESLLKEQGELAFAASSTSSTLASNTPLKNSDSKDTCSSVSSGASSVSSRTMETSAASASAASTSLQSASSVKTVRKKHKPLKLHKLYPRKTLKNQKSKQTADENGSSARHHHARVAPIEAYNQMYNPALSSNETAICLETIMAKKHLLVPSAYVHPKCLLQKDKGRGEKLQTCISARGRDSCLEKLRHKMRLVIQVASSGKEDTLHRLSATGMKRRSAKISAVGSSYVETRSMLELQLGFLSMQYGLLLQWDTVQTGKIVFICLRKMCHDSFYSKIPDLLPEPTVVYNQHQQKWKGFNRQHRSQPCLKAAAKQDVAPPLVVRSHQGNHAIYQRPSGATEVVLVDAPYRVPQPEVFAPSVLSVDIHQITGLDHIKSKWTLSITFDGHTEIAHLEYNPNTNALETTRTTPCRWEMMLPREMTSFDLAGLEIRLFEQRTGRRGVGKKILGNNESITNSNNTRHSRHSSNGSLSSFGSVTSASASNGTKSPNKSTSRLASTMTMPLGGLVSQPSTSPTTVWKLSIPFTHDERAQLSLSLTHQSEYANWLHKELRARRKEEIAASSLLSGGSFSSWKPAILKRLVSSKDKNAMGMDDNYLLGDGCNEDDDDEVYLSDWLCGICYLFPCSISG